MNKINPFDEFEFIRNNARAYAQAKADVIYMTEYRKSIKAELMNDCDSKTQSASEAYAYAHPKYKTHLEALKQSVARFEELRWGMVSAEAKIEVWRSLEASSRMEGRASQ